MFLRRQRHQNIDIFDPRIDTEHQNAGTSVTLAPRAVIRAPKHHNTMAPRHQNTQPPWRLDIKISKYLRARGQPVPLERFPWFDPTPQNRQFWYQNHHYSYIAYIAT